MCACMCVYVCIEQLMATKQVHEGISINLTGQQQFSWEMT